jgi:predicted DNA repair protein MutK
MVVLVGVSATAVVCTVASLVTTLMVPMVSVGVWMFMRAGRTGSSAETLAGASIANVMPQVTSAVNRIETLEALVVMAHLLKIALRPEL